MNPEELLAHADFVHTLARSLVLDPNAADDIAQQTWVAALEHPPADTGSRTAWFSKVVRNFARILYRTEQRLGERQARAARTESSPSSDEIVEKMETRRRLIDAVLSLEEPYRSAIVLRYYDDLPPRKIAKQFDVPVETVRTRLKRGIERLRVRLDEQYGGSRKAWCLALAPIAGLILKGAATGSGTAIGSTAAHGTNATHGANAATGTHAIHGANAATGTNAVHGATATTSHAAAVPTVATVATGALIMSMKLKLLLAAAAVIVTTFAFWQLLPEEYDPHSDPVPLSAGNHEIQVTGLTEEEKELEAHEREHLVPENRINDSGNMADVEAQPETLIAGRVVDMKTGEPVTTFRFGMRYRAEGAADNITLSEIVEDENGCFSFPIENSGKGSIGIQSSKHLYKYLDINVPDEQGLSDLLIELDPGYTGLGQVVDHDTGDPIEGAVVRSVPMLTSDHNILRIRRGEETCCNFAITDSHGDFTLNGLDEGNYRRDKLRGKWQLAAAHPEYAEGFSIAKAGEKSRIEIRLKQGFRISGKAFDDEGQPAQGVMISAVGEVMPVCRDVLTDENGCFQTAPVPPGRIYLCAGPPPDVDLDFRFTSERKWVDISDSDVRVDFGPEPGQVEWTGTFFDAAGEPVPGGQVTIVPVHVSFAHSLEFNMSTTVRCDGKGRFLFKKLVPGAYKVTLRWSAKYDWGKINLDSPGIVTRDLHVSGGTIRGVVVDGRTGYPPEALKSGGRSYVSTDIHSPEFLFYSATIDDNGRFTLNGLPAGRYDLDAHVDGWPYTLQKGVMVEEGQVTENVRIEVFPGGRLQVKLKGFESTANRDFKLSVAKQGKADPYYKAPYHIGDTGEWEYERLLHPGVYVVSLIFTDSWYAERTCEVREDEITKVVIHKEEISTFQGDVTVSGTFLHADGTPVINARVSLYGQNVPGLEGEDRSKGDRTDDEGCFTIPECRPGMWNVSARLANGGNPSFSVLCIPPAPADPYPLHLVLPPGKVTGSLADARTGKRFVEGGPRWWVCVHDVREQRNVSQLHSKQSGPRFTIHGVPDGEYKIIAAVRGYKEYQSSTFRIKNGQCRDMGELRFEPCGVLNLKVVDDLDEPIDNFTLTCDGEQILYVYRERLTPGTYCYYKLPLGELDVMIEAEGFKTSKRTVSLEPGETGELEIVLSRS